MAEEKPLEPTPEKIRKARKKGQVAQSADLTAAGLVVCGGLTLSILAESSAVAVKAMAVRSFEAATGLARHRELDAQDVAAVLTSAGADAFGTLASVVLPLLLVVLAAGFAVPFLQVGPLLTFEPLKPKMDKLNPAKGLQNIFFKARTYVDVGKGALRVVIVAAVVWVVVYGMVPTVLMSPALSPAGAAEMTLGMARRILYSVAVAFVALGAADLLLQRARYMKENRMGYDEMKQEHKESEGSPESKQAREELKQEIAAGAMMNEVGDATAVVTNPTHYACAIRYDGLEGELPRLVAKGKDLLAERIKSRARERGVPVLPEKYLARALYALPLKSHVKPEMFDAVKAVLEWTERLAEERGAPPPKFRRNVKRWARPAEPEGTEGDAGT